MIERCEGAGVDAFELNFSCPHGLPEDFKAITLAFFTTHAELGRLQADKKAAQKATAAAAQQKRMIAADGEWSGDSFVQQSDALARG